MMSTFWLVLLYTHYSAKVHIIWAWQVHQCHEVDLWPAKFPAMRGHLREAWYVARSSEKMKASLSLCVLVICSISQLGTGAQCNNNGPRNDCG